jgi:uncharacterized membrane protein YphA (DoxX/SURF4 family)
MEQGGFLPPQAAGPEPQLGEVQAPQPTLTGGFAPPSQATPPGPQAQPGWRPAPQQAWAPAPPTGPDNGPAVLGFSLALSSIGLLFITAGLSSLVSLALGIVGMLQGAKGKRLVREGQTQKHKDLAQAGFVIGIVATVIAALLTLFWIGIAIAVVVDESTRRQFEDQLDEQRGEPAVVPTAVFATVRVIGLLLQ